MGDVRLLLWLRVRHARTFLVRAMRIVGTDIQNDRDLGERAYQLYAAAALLVVCVLMWFWAIDTVEGAFVALGPAVAAALLPLALAVPAAVFAAVAFSGLRASPLKFSHPDVAYLAGSSVRSTALAGTAFAAAALAGGVFAALAGYLLGAGMAAALGTFASPLATACCAALAVAAAIGGGWLVGLARLALPRATRRRRAGLAALALATAIVAGLAGALSVAAAPLALAEPGFAAFACAGAVVLVGAESVGLALLARRADIVRAVEDSSLYADLQPFGPFSPLDPTVVGDYRRRCKLARRSPRLRLPAATGPGALLARSALTIVRQHEGVPDLLMLGIVVTPFGVVALTGALGPVGLLFWLALLVAAPQGRREATRAFRDDMRVRLVRDRLPFGTLALLALDSLPAFVVVALLSCAVVPFAIPAGASMGASLALAVLLNAATLLSCGLDAVRLGAGGLRPWSEGALVALAATCGALSFAPSPWLAVAGAAFVCLVVAWMIRGGAECAR